MSPVQLCVSLFRPGGIVCLLKQKKKDPRKQEIAVTRIIAVLLRLMWLDLSTPEISFAVSKQLLALASSCSAVLV